MRITGKRRISDIRLRGPTADEIVGNAADRRRHRAIRA